MASIGAGEQFDPAQSLSATLLQPEMLVNEPRDFAHRYSGSSASGESQALAGTAAEGSGSHADHGNALDAVFTSSV